ncbi:acyltransferase family protein [Desulfogranum mediterraneum]|uniref:acyltransferase family protein n=1 Tax=Desulfogranum mediterraneum TaxID=160661 RepID=UPI0003FD3786|nr:acyltransferase [Desulfogranum mediterraneum]
MVNPVEGQATGITRTPKKEQDNQAINIKTTRKTKPLPNSSPCIFFQQEVTIPGNETTASYTKIATGKPKVNDNIAWVNYAKAIGIILVVYGHVARGLFNAGIKIDEMSFKIIDNIIYSFHMPLFFFLSGLFFFGSLEKRGKAGLIFSKIDTIVYPYLLWSLIQGFIEVILSSYTNGSTSYSEVLSLFWKPRAQFWFLYALFVCFITASITINKKDCQFLATATIISSMLYLFQYNIPYIFPLSFIPRYFIFFVFGIFFKNVLDLFPLNPRLTLPTSTALFITIQYLSNFTSFPQKNHMLMSLATALVSIYFIVTLSKSLSKKRVCWLSSIGAASMPIYVMHTLIASGGRIALQKFLGIENVMLHLALGCTCGVMIPLAAVRFHFLFRLPMSDWLRKKPTPLKPPPKQPRQTDNAL